MNIEQPTCVVKSPRKFSLMKLILLIGLMGVFFYGLFYAMGAYLIYGDELKKSDYIVVLSGGGDSSRLEEAARLYKEKYGTRLVFTETGTTVLDTKVLISVEWKAAAVKLGVPSTAILVTEKTVSSTREEVVAIKKMMSKAGKKTCIIVTDPSHTMRTKTLVNTIFKDTGMSCGVHPIQNSWYQPGTWFLSVEGWQTTLTEYVKVLANWLGIVRD